VLLAVRHLAVAEFILATYVCGALFILFSPKFCPALLISSRISAAFKLGAHCICDAFIFLYIPLTLFRQQH